MKRVYFIRPVGMKGPIKIGCAISPDGRRNTLQTWCPFPLEIIAEIEGDYTLERRFHGAFIGSHQGHEWFAWTARLQATIDEIRGGAFSVDTLPMVRGCPCLRGKDGKTKTPEQRRQLSYSLRIGHLERKSGFFFAGKARCVVRHGKTADADAFLLAPHLHGVPVANEWAVQARRKWLAERQMADAA